MAPAPFATLTTDVDGVHVVAVQGELDLSTAPELEQALAPLGSGHSVVIDLAECEFIDSTGIALIVRTWQRIDGEDGKQSRFAICGANDQVRRVLEISGLDNSIPVRQNRDEGLAALRDTASA